MLRASARLLPACLALLALLSSARGAPQSFYISQSGTGSGFGTPGNPLPVTFFNNPNTWSSSFSAGMISPGDTINLIGTITSQLTVQASGTSGNPITILFAPGAKLSAAAGFANGAIYAVNINYIIINGDVSGGQQGIIECTNNGSPGTYANQADPVKGIYASQCGNWLVENLTIQNLYVKNSDTDLGGQNSVCIQDDCGGGTNLANFKVTNCTMNNAWHGFFSGYSAGTSTIEVSFCTVTACNWGIALGDNNASATCDNVLIHDNNVGSSANWDYPPDPDQNHHDYIFCYATRGQMTGVNIYNNFLGPGYGDCTAAIFIAYNVNAVVYNNICIATTDRPDDGLIYQSNAGSFTPVVRIYNNTLIGLGGSQPVGIDLGGSGGNQGGSGLSTVDIRNNLMSGVQTAIEVTYKGGISLASDYNLFYNLNNSQAYSFSSTDQGSFDSLAEWQGAGFDLHSQTTDPDLNGGYAPQPPSGAIDTGTSTAADGSQLSSYFATDRAGAFRPQGAGWDIGAYEYVSPVSATIRALTVPSPTPVIVSPTTVACTINTAFAYTIIASNSPTSYSASGLPGGLSIDAATGAIAGTPTAAGASNVTISATNAVGTGSAALILIVNQASVAGVYFGTFANGGNWALNVTPDNLAEFIAYVGGGSIAQNATINSDGSFSLPGVSISGVISQGGVVGTAGSAALIGSQDIGTSQSGIAGFYSTAALFGAPGNAYAVIGGDGQILAVVSGASPDAASGKIDIGGSMNASTMNGGAITIAINTVGQISVSLTPEDSTASTTYSGLSSGVTSTARLANLSARATAGPGSNALIAGFTIIEATKSILVRGIGPGLLTYGVPGTLTDPQLSVTGGEGVNTVNYFNDSWGGAPALQAAFIQTGAFALAPASADAALIDSFAPGVYTAVVTGANNGSGVALIELYDADTSPAPAGQLSNISARAQVGAGINVLSAGFVISGNAPETVLIRAVGPGLAQFGVSGVLANPQLDLYQGSTDLLENAGWGGGSALSAAFAAAGAFNLDPGSADSAMIVTLPPGSYTAVVSGVNNTTGVALAEVYQLP